MHKCIIAEASDFFRVACEQDFKFKLDYPIQYSPHLLMYMQEKEQASVELAEDDPIAVEIGLMHVYTCRYVVPNVERIDELSRSTQPSSSTTNTQATEGGDTNSLQTELTDGVALLKIHAQVYQLSNKLGLTPLQSSAQGRFNNQLQEENFSNQTFPSLVSLIFDIMAPDDKLLIEFTQFCTRHYTGPPNSEIAKAFQEKNAVVWEVGRNLQRQSNASERRIQELEAEKRLGTTEGPIFGQSPRFIPTSPQPISQFGSPRIQYKYGGWSRRSAYGV